MSTETLTQAIAAGGTVIFGSGSQFLVMGATGPITIVAQTLGSSSSNRKFTNVTEGFRFKAKGAKDAFTTLTVTSTTAQDITIAVGDDDVEFSSAVSITNIPQVQDEPAAALTDTAPVPVAAGAQDHVIAQNLGRRRVTLTADPAAAGVVYVRAYGGANDLVPLSPGESYEFRGAYGLDVRNPQASAVNVYVAEET